MGEEQEEAAEIGWEEMKTYLESPAKQLGQEDTTAFEQGCDMVTCEVRRTSRCFMGGFIRGRGSKSVN